MSIGPIQDPATYEAMSRPFPSQSDAEEALEAFFHEVRAVRIKYGIRDVHLSVLDSIQEEGDAVRDVFVDMHIGSSAFAMPMAAAALGAQKGRHEQRLADYEAMGHNYGRAEAAAAAVPADTAPPPAATEPTEPR